MAPVASGAARGQLACIGDCGGDGTVSIADLVVGVTAVLSDDAPDGCVAWDPDGDSHVRVDDLVRGIARALAGPCRPSATPTATPTVPADPLLVLIQPVWVEACTRLGGFLDGESSASEDGVSLYCRVGPGHDNHTTLTRYDRRMDADSAFASASAGFGPASLRDLPAAYYEEPFSPDFLMGAYRTLTWQLDCWVATVASFDDTSYRFAPNVYEFSAAILDVAGDALLARCDTAPAATPTPPS